MPSDPRVNLEDVEQASAEVEDFIAGMSYTEWCNDLRTQRAVERSFGIIGEAMNRLNRTAPDVFRRIALAGRIVSFRNLLAHEYHRVDPETVWNVANVRLPELRQTVQLLLNELSHDTEISEPSPEADQQDDSGGSCEPF